MTSSRPSRPVLDRSLRVALVTASSLLTAVMGCGPRANQDVLAVRRAVNSLQSTAAFPFEIQSISIESSQPVGIDQYQVRFQVTGLFRRDQHVELDKDKLFPSPGMIREARGILADVRIGLPEQADKYDADIQALAAPSQSVFRIACKAGESCILNGEINSSLKNGKWLRNNVMVTMLATASLPELSYETRNGSWDGRGLVSPRAPRPECSRYDSQHLSHVIEPASVPEKLPADAVVIEVQDAAGTNKRQQMGKIINALTELRKQLVIERNALNESERNRTLDLGNQGFRFRRTGPDGVTRDFYLESNVPYDDRPGVTQIYDVNEPFRRQAYTTTFVVTRERGPLIYGAAREHSMCECRPAGKFGHTLLGTEKFDSAEPRPVAFRIVPGEENGTAIEIDGEVLSLNPTSRSTDLLRRGDYWQFMSLKLRQFAYWEGVMYGPKNVQRPITLYATSMMTHLGGAIWVVEFPDAPEQQAVYETKFDSSEGLVSPILARRVRSFTQNSPPSGRELPPELLYFGAFGQELMGTCAEGSYRIRFNKHSQLDLYNHALGSIREQSNRELTGNVHRDGKATELRLRMKADGRDVELELASVADPQQTTVYAGTLVGTRYGEQFLEMEKKSGAGSRATLGNLAEGTLTIRFAGDGKTMYGIARAANSPDEILVVPLPEVKKRGFPFVPAPGVPTGRRKS